MKIGVLTTVDAPLLGRQIQDILDAGQRIEAIIFDSQSVSERDHKIHEERTGGHLPPVPLWRFEKHAIPCYFVARHDSSETTQLVRQLGLDVLINGGTPRILKGSILDMPRFGVLNCHPGLLPMFRGCTCVEWAIYLDEQIGNTVHRMTEGIDEGPVLLSEPLTFAKTDGYIDVRVKVYAHASRMMGKALRLLDCGEMSEKDFTPQKEGRYFRVIDAEKMREVLAKLDAGLYRFQY